MREAGAGVEDGPDVVDHLTVGPHHVKVESVWILVLEVAKEGLAEPRGLDHPTDRIALEEGVELCHGSVQGLGGGATLELKVHLLGVGGAVAGGVDEGSELLGMEGSVLDGGICKPVGKEPNTQ